MTKKDYIRLAAAMLETKPHGRATPSAAAALTQWSYMVRTLADALADDSPRFDRQRFQIACGLPPPE
jgi:hypothetical protein